MFGCIYLLTIFKQSFSIFCIYLNVLILKRRIPLETALQLLSLCNHLLSRWWQEAPLHAVQAASDKHNTGPSQLKNRARCSLATPLRAQRGSLQQS